VHAAAACILVTQHLQDVVFALLLLLLLLVFVLQLLLSWLRCCQACRG
jgi:hypothetical protein